jgi:hypothetical protein
MKFLLFFFGFIISIASKGDGYQVFDENGKKGIKDELGQIVIPASFDALGWSDGNFSVVGQTTGYRLNEKWGLINLKKEFVTPAEFEWMVYGNGEYVIAKKRLNAVSVKVGCLNLQGEIKIPFLYDGIEVNGLRAIVFNRVGSRYDVGLIDLQNRVLIPLTHNRIFSLGTLRYAVENREGKIALFDESGKPVTGYTIDSLSGFDKGFFVVYQNGLRGLMNREGELKVPIQYSDIAILDDGNVKLKLPGEWHFLDQQNKLIKKILADSLEPVSQQRNIIFLGGKCGLLDEQQNVLLPIQWDNLQEFSPGIFLAKSIGKYGVLKTDGKYIISNSYDSINRIVNGFRVYKKGRGWQLLNEVGATITDKSYEAIHSFNGSTWLVKHRGYTGVLSASGTELVHCVFDSIGDRTTSLIAVKFKGQFGIIDFQENWRLAPQPFPIRLANDDRYLQMEAANSFLKSMNGDIIYFTSYPVRFEKEYWVEEQNGKEKAITYDGMPLQLNQSQLQATTSAKNTFRLQEGLMGMLIDGKFGFVDAFGKLAIANRYDSISNFQEGVAPVKLIGLWGFINSSDQLIIQPNYESVTPFINGLSIVKRKAMMGVINKMSKPVISLKYQTIKRLANGKFLLGSNGLWGLASADGVVLIEPRFTFLKEVMDRYLLVCQSAKWGLLTTEGLDIIPMVYDKLHFDTANGQYIGMVKSQWKAFITD